MVSGFDAAMEPMKRTRKAGNGAVLYTGVDRRQNGESLKRGEFSSFAGEIRGRLDNQDTTLKRLDTAMFSKDSDNEHGVPGVMVVMQKIDQHIDVVCAWARTVKKALKWVGVVATTIGAVAGAVYYGHVAGWW